MTAMDCADLADTAPELALGVLYGHERAEALAHLDECGVCRQLVSSLSGATDELLRVLAPSVQPPAGFEDRVLEAMAPTAGVAPARIRRRWASAVMAAAACVALFLGAVTIGSSTHPAFAAARMRTESGDVVGWIYVDNNQPAVYMSLPGWAEQMQRYGRSGDTYSLRLTDRSGIDHVQSVSLNSEATWKAALRIDPNALASAALLDGRGHVWCQADFE